jgi:hypothetical protein
MAESEHPLFITPSLIAPAALAATGRHRPDHHVPVRAIRPDYHIPGHSIRPDLPHNFLWLKVNTPCSLPYAS